MLKEKIQNVRDRMERAAARSGRNASGITLLAVTKKFPAALLREAWEAGLREFGENYVQEFEEKYPLLQDLEGARFHLIGHLQSNKTSVASRLFDVIQTVDTSKLARRLDAAGKALDVMLEVKLSEGRLEVGGGAGESGGTGGRGFENAGICGCWADDHAAVVRRCRTVAAVFRATAGTGGGARFGAALDGDVA